MSCRRACPLTSVILLLGGLHCAAQQLPATAGESLSGHRVVIAEAARGHATLLIASFSKDAGPLADEWARAARADASLASVTVYEAAMLERAPGLIRGMIVSSMRRQTPTAAQDNFIVLTQDEKLWRAYFGVSTDKDPWIVLLDAAGNVRWHGHGAAQSLEPLLRPAVK